MKHKLKAIFLYKKNNSYVFVKEKRIRSITKEVIKFNEKPFNFDKSAPTYITDKISYYFFNIDKGFVPLNDIELPNLPLDLIDGIINKHIISDLIYRIKSKINYKDILLYVCLGIGIGLGIGYILRGFIG